MNNQRQAIAALFDNCQFSRTQQRKTFKDLEIQKAYYRRQIKAIQDLNKRK